MTKALRYSRQRERIYDYLLMSEEHPSADMIYSNLKREFPELSLGTVYRNLNLLEKLGMIRKVTSFQGNERYDAICGDHAHFICQQCGSIVDLKSVDSEQIRSKIKVEDGYRVSKLDMMITGMCPQCGGCVAD